MYYLLKLIKKLNKILNYKMLTNIKKFLKDDLINNLFPNKNELNLE